MKIFKIKRLSDGLYSTGGMRPDFTKLGKIWKTEGHLKSHLNQFQPKVAERHKHVYDDCVVVTLEVVESELDSIGVFAYLDEIDEKRKQKEQEWEEKRKQWKLDQERAKYEELKKKFGDG